VINNAQGREVMKEYLNGATNRFNVSQLPQGVYFYRIMGKEKLSGGKLIIQ